MVSVKKHKQRKFIDFKEEETVTEMFALGKQTLLNRKSLICFFTAPSTSNKDNSTKKGLL